MVARLGRELEVYSTHIAHLDTLAGSNTLETYQLKTWQTLVEQEKSQSELFSELVHQQSEIIKTLLSGTSATSEEMKAILQEVGETQELLLLTNRQTAETRSTLIPL
jgi:hypothetical protein